MKKYAKSLAQVAAAALAALVAVLADNQVSVGEWINVAIAVTTAAAVFTAPNIPQHKTIKSVLAVLGAMLTLAVSLITDGLTTAEVIQLALAGLGALGVYAFPNAGDTLARAARPQPAMRL
ncbi:hypothetical protein GCM10010124_26310 [Pilimelia terevasa]|uniref:Holin n=1 Tax=Pilimelia terevasa TaxID=53372 RepID=A0A8J3FL59_9ACTN|nr:hypothetical protein [Pilimelia terevasa]GGK32275.1 hypothetical protein GCM10010124_26310 [Pilimelia terevasa]